MEDNKVLKIDPKQAEEAKKSLESADGTADCAPNKSEQYENFVKESRAKSGADVVKYLSDKNLLDVYIFIRDIMTTTQIKEIKADSALNTKFSKLKSEAGATWKKYNSVITFGEANNMCMEFYKSAVSIIKKMNDAYLDEIDKYDAKLAAIMKISGITEKQLAEAMGTHDTECGGGCDCGSGSCGCGDSGCKCHEDESETIKESGTTK